MRSINIGAASVAWLLCACGSSAGNALFGGSGGPACDVANGCGSPMNAGSPNADGGGIAGGAVSNGTGGAGVQQGAGGEPDVGGGNAGGDVGSGGVQAGEGDGGAAGAHGGAGGAESPSCPLGDYHAMLTGQYRSGLGSNDIGATVDFTVADAGAVQGTFMGPGGAQASVTGSVDCATGTLTATIENGAYGVGLAMIKFSGTFDGTYDPIGAGFAGTWTIMEGNSPNNGGTGPWSTL